MPLQVGLLIIINEPPVPMLAHLFSATQAGTPCARHLSEAPPVQRFRCTKKSGSEE
jgi:hypothetical protein